MSSSSSSYIRSGPRRSVLGVPTRCWCGQGLDTWVSETKDNPYRRFYRCKIALQKKTESHLFKWIDEALLDETRMVDAKLLDLVHDFQTNSRNCTTQVESLKSWVLAREEQMTKHFNEKMLHKSRTFDDATKDLKERIEANIYDHTSKDPSTHGPILKIAVAVVVLGAMSYWKIF